MTCFVLPEGAIITPAARTFLADHKISLEMTGRASAENRKEEHKTHLRKDVLVPKTNLQIAFRGKLDSLEGKIIMAQVRLSALNRSALVEDLQKLLEIVRSILRAEVLDVPVGDWTLMEMSEDELREASHHPEEKLGVKHFIPDFRMGEEMALLNLLRVDVRETELAACAAFSCGFQNGTVKRPDILKALNRLSSGVYCMMCRLKNDSFYQGR